MRAYFPFLMFLFFYSCSTTDPVPDNILPKEKMQVVLYDIFKADELANQLKNNDTIKPDLQWHTELYDQIFKLHKVSKEEFTTSFRFYQTRPDLMKPMLEALSKKSDQSVKSN